MLERPKTVRLLGEKLGIEIPKTIDDEHYIHVENVVREMLHAPENASGLINNSTPPVSSASGLSQNAIDKILKEKLKELLDLEILEETYSLNLLRLRTEQDHKPNPARQIKISKLELNLQMLSDEKFHKINELEHLKQKFKRVVQDKSIIHRIDRATNGIMDRMKTNALYKRNRKMNNQDAIKMVVRKENKREGTVHKKVKNINKDAGRNAISLPHPIPYDALPQYSYTRLFNKPGSVANVNKSTTGGVSMRSNARNDVSGMSDRIKLRFGRSAPPKSDATSTFKPVNGAGGNQVNKRNGGRSPSVVDLTTNKPKNNRRRITPIKL
jgi:hypothetical protein